MDNNAISISVIIPVYNVSAYVEKCIQSVMDQTYTDFECILVDDCGTDDSIAKCEKMIADYEGSIRFRMLHHEYNRGLSAARNTGTDAATGDYILYIDSDDSITSDCIEKLRAPIMRDDTIEMVMAHSKHVSDTLQLPQQPTPNWKNEDISGLANVRDYFFSINGNMAAAWNKLIRRNFLTHFGLTFKEGLLWEDQLWIFYVMKHLSHLYMIKDVTYLYCRHPHSISMGTDAKEQRYHWGIIYHEISKNLTCGDSYREVCFYLKRFYNYYINSSQNKLYQKTAENFRRELSFKHDTSIYMRLLMVGFLSKTWMGRHTYHSLRKAYRLIRFTKVYNN